MGKTGRADVHKDKREKEAGDFLFLAYGTNFFQAGHANKEELSILNLEKLLELRIFSDEQEIYFSRSCIG